MMHVQHEANKSFCHKNSPKSSPGVSNEKLSSEKHKKASCGCIKLGWLWVCLLWRSTQREGMEGQQRLHYPSSSINRRWKVCCTRRIENPIWSHDKMKWSFNQVGKFFPSFEHYLRIFIHSRGWKREACKSFFPLEFFAVKWQTISHCRVQPASSINLGHCLPKRTENLWSAGMLFGRALRPRSTMHRAVFFMINFVLCSSFVRLSELACLLCAVQSKEKCFSRPILMQISPLRRDKKKALKSFHANGKR